MMDKHQTSGPENQRIYKFTSKLFSSSMEYAVKFYKTLMQVVGE
jgi:hypothetical protein